MKSNGKNYRLVSGMGWLTMVLLLGLASSGWAVTNESTITIQDAMANVGDTVEVSLTLDVLYDPPATLVLFLEYDPLKLSPNASYYENIVMNPLYPDQPLLDGNGVAMSAPSAVRMSANNLGKSVEIAVHPEGVLAIAIQGGLEPLNYQDGYLLTVAFDVIDGAENEALLLNGVQSDAPVELLNVDEVYEYVSSSGASEYAELVEVVMVDGVIQIGCEAPLAPAVVTASQGLASGIEISWSPVTGGTVQYRVYRSLFTANPNTSVPLGNGWLSSSTYSYQDLTALPFNDGGASCAPQIGNTYYYWVKSRSLSGCESDYSDTAAEGTRAKSAALETEKASILPMHSGEVLAIILALLTFVALRRRSQHSA